MSTALQIVFAFIKQSLKNSVGVSDDQQQAVDRGEQSARGVEAMLRQAKEVVLPC